jgi:hypothetical protein
VSSGDQRVWRAVREHCLPSSMCSNTTSGDDARFVDSDTIVVELNTQHSNKWLDPGVHEQFEHRSP